MDAFVADRSVKDERVYAQLYSKDYVNKQKKQLEMGATEMVIGIVTRCQGQTDTRGDAWRSLRT